jgi:dihydroorotate dehydrogenase electron transfer subunit
LEGVTSKDIIRMVDIADIITESPSVRTIIFADYYSVLSSPGQFLMVWIPPVEELPMSVATETLKNHEYAAVTVRKYGMGSTALYHKQIGEQIGIRGPYGNKYSIPKNTKKALVVGGGTGLVPLLRLCEELQQQARANVTLIMGSRTKKEVLFEQKARRILSKDPESQLEISTDDGTYGFKGSAVELAESILQTKEIQVIYTCGPELMMKALLELGELYSVRVEASLERYMKCAIGICGSCCINNRLVCQDGTIFDSSTLRQLSEFGVSYRDKSGRISYFDH